MSHPNQGPPGRGARRSEQPTQIAPTGWPQQPRPQYGAPPPPYGAPPSPYGAPPQPYPPYGAAPPPYPQYGAPAPAPEPRPVRRMSWGWGVAGGIAVVAAIALLVVTPEIVGPSVSLFAAVQLVILGLLLILIPVSRGTTIGFVVVGVLAAAADIALAGYGSFGLTVCGYGDGPTAFEVWRSRSECPASIGARELEKWAIVGAFGVVLIVIAACAMRSFLRNRRSA